VLDIGGADGVGERDLDRERGPVRSFHYEVDLVVGVLGAEVADALSNIWTRF